MQCIVLCMSFYMLPAPFSTKHITITLALSGEALSLEIWHLSTKKALTVIFQVSKW